MDPYLSIIVPIYNVEKYIHRCLDSIVEEVLACSETTGWRDPAKGECAAEVLLIDDGSTDGSGRVAEEYQRRYGFFKVIRQDNGGVARARNTGLEAAGGKWIYLMDSDDWLAKGAIKEMLDCIRKHGSADLFLFDAYQNTFEKESVWEHFATEGIVGSDAGLRRLQRRVLYSRGTPLAAPWDKVYRADLLRKNDIRFREHLRVLDDMVFNVEAMGVAARVYYCKKRIYHYRYVPDSITNRYRPDRIQQDRQVWKYLKKYMSVMDDKDAWTQQEREAFRQSYYCRIIKSFAIACKVCFFHEQNKESLKRKGKRVRRVLLGEPYREAFLKVRWQHPEWRLKVLILLVRLGIDWGIYWLYRANRRLEKRRCHP